MFSTAKISNRPTITNPRPTSDRRRSKRRTQRTLRCESLAKRELMAADFGMQSGTLQIDGDDHDNHIVIRKIAAAQPLGSQPQGVFTAHALDRILVTVTDRTSGRAQQRSFFSFSIDDLDITTGNGRNSVNNLTDLPSRIVGGDGSDTISGGANDDVIFGGGGIDFLYGRGGNDELNGEGGPDILVGNQGDDVLRGGTGRDRLDGGHGDDRLLGGDDIDTLIGGTGNDALIGNAGRDVLWSSSGRDRFLIDVGDNDQIRDADSMQDVVLEFRNATEVEPGPRIEEDENMTAYPGTWSEEEMETIDGAFQMMFDATGNNSLLEKPNGDRNEFVRHRQLYDGTRMIVGSPGAWNSIGGAIHFVENAFREDLQRVVIHELAHNFHSESNNPFIDEFREAGTWREVDSETDTRDLTQARLAYASDWYFETESSNAFARAYGQDSIEEDFATSMAAKILTDNGIDYLSEDFKTVRTRMQARFEVLDDFFASLA
ncbi:Hemolysin-type calcium-binding repeat-containing protein [Neorhodopirellula lusitana]|uniref:Hemolysin-type calcium-binding repeat-containing protein n=1 Tax=Neorhodopirellula lusitana TaxID=445327 RepID=A0ABY1QRS4_9BACT|nr:calcium-binding protein [Neorhodopirellula lusitana]SMP79033.1 Hemolysin-type calcium-binding repeat-containing protein [Neorhodopirellula lusitana]